MPTYTPPGVFFKNSTASNFTSSAVSPASVGIFGLPQATATLTEEIVIPADVSGSSVASSPLSKANASVSSITLTGSDTALKANTDYKLETSKTGDDVFTTIRRADSSTALTGTTRTSVTVTYSYTASNLYEPLRFSTVADVEAFYGVSVSGTYEVNSPISLAARLAFLNGASTVICVAVKSSSPSDIEAAINKLASQTDVAIVVPAVGDPAVFSAVASSVKKASDSELERRAIVGIDGSTQDKDSTAFTSAASSVKSSRCIVVAPGSADYRVDSGNTIKLGGQYLAAALAGVAISLDVQVPLTRKRVYGFTAVDDSFDTGEKNILSAAGVCVIEQTVTGITRVRHGVTTDNSSKNTSEWSITGSADYVISNLRSTLDSADYIGSPVTDTTVLSIKGLMDAFLSSSVADGVIGSYDNLTVAQRTSEPDVIDISVEIGFLYPLNRIYVTLTSSSLTGDTTATASDRA